jgi:hypothetical protein
MWDSVENGWAYNVKAKRKAGSHASNGLAGNE